MGSPGMIQPCSRSPPGCSRSSRSARDTFPPDGPLESIRCRHCATSSRAPSRPHHRHAIGLERAIRCENREPFVQRLRYQQAVEQVTVVAWQITQQVPVTYGHVKWEKTIALHDVSNRVLQVQLAYASLDGDLPRADGAHHNEFGPLHRADGSGPKLLQVPPNQRVGIEQQPHSDSPVNKRNTSGGSGASKSSAIQPLPFPNPYLRKWRVSFGASGTRRALGFPDLAMTISRPCAACSTSSERWVFASYRLTGSRTEGAFLRRRIHVLILYLTKLVKPTHPSPLRGSSSTPVSHTSPAPPTCTPAHAPSSSPAAGPAPPPARPGPTAAARRRS